jgi:hypothetical protein
MRKRAFHSRRPTELVGRVRQTKARNRVQARII